MQKLFRTKIAEIVFEKYNDIKWKLHAIPSLVVSNISG